MTFPFLFCSEFFSLWRHLIWKKRGGPFILIGTFCLGPSLPASGPEGHRSCRFWSIVWTGSQMRRRATAKRERRWMRPTTRFLCATDIVIQSARFHSLGPREHSPKGSPALSTPAWLVLFFRPLVLLSGLNIYQSWRLDLYRRLIETGGPVIACFFLSGLTGHFNLGGVKNDEKFN